MGVLSPLLTVVKTYHIVFMLTVIDYEKNELRSQNPFYSTVA